MQWELLTSKELEEMAKKEKICLSYPTCTIFS